MQEDFEQWFLSMGDDVDETLLIKYENANEYKDEFTESLWFAFKAGHLTGTLSE